MQLSISCRAGRTELVVAGPTVAGKGEDLRHILSLDGNVPVQIAADLPSFGTGATGSIQGRRCALAAVVPRGGRHRRPAFPPERVLSVRALFRSTD